MTCFGRKRFQPNCKIIHHTPLFCNSSPYFFRFFIIDAKDFLVFCPFLQGFVYMLITWTSPWGGKPVSFLKISLLTNPCPGATIPPNSFHERGESTMKKFRAASMNRMEMCMCSMCMSCCAEFFDVLSVIAHRGSSVCFPVMPKKEASSEASFIFLQKGLLS